MSVYDEGGAVRDLFSLWRDRKVIVAFTRHMGCRFCKEQVLLLEKCRADYLAGAAVDTIIVSIGRYEDIPQFRKETDFAGEIYVDTDLESPKCFQLLQFESGKHVLFADAEGKEVLPSTLQAAQRSSVCLPDGGYGSDAGPYTGNVLQIGGVFVLGPGNTCDFMFRSAFVGDIPDMLEVCAAATGVVPKSEEQAVYPQALQWNTRLRLDSRVDPAAPDPACSQPIQCPIATPKKGKDPATAQDTSQWRYGALVAIAACLLFAPSTVEGPVFAALAIVTGFLLFYYRPRSAGGSDSASPAHAGQVELITMRQLDQRTLLRGGSKCECGFIKDIDMSVLKTPAAALSAEEIAAMQVPEEHQQPLESIQCYVREFLAKPNPLLGRKGPTCPFVPASLKMDSIHLGLVTRELVHDMVSMERIVMGMIERFKHLEPTTGPKAQYKAIILIFPFISLEEAPEMIDGLQKKLKPLFVSEGLMVGEFHKLNNACGLHNDSFFPLRTPTPCLAIRNMVPSDIVFLNGAEFSADTRRRMISRYLEKFGDSSSKNDEQTEVARNLLKDLGV